MSSSTTPSEGRFGKLLLLLLVCWVIYHYPLFFLACLAGLAGMLIVGLYLLHLEHKETSKTSLHRKGFALHSSLLDLLLYPDRISPQVLNAIAKEIKAYTVLAKEMGVEPSVSPAELSALWVQIKQHYLSMQPQKAGTAKPQTKAKAKPKKAPSEFDLQVSQCLRQAQSVANFENTSNAGKRRVLAALAENITPSENTRAAIVNACMAKVSTA